MQTRLRGALEMSAAMVISGTIGWFVVRFDQPLVDVLFWRCVFGAATLFVACAALGVLRRGLTPRTFALAAFGGVALVANWLLIFASFSRASISIATAVYNTQPFMLVALGALFFSERLTAMKVGWLCIAFAGVVLVAQAKGGGGSGDYITGVLMALGAAFFYAVAAIVAKKLGDMAPHLIALIQVCVGIAMLAPFAHLRALPTDAGIWGIHLTMGVIYTGLVFILLYGAIQKLPTTVAGALSFIYPLVAIGVDFVAFGQRLTPAQLVGAAAILIAAAGMTFGWRLPGLPGRSPAARKS
ncbi:multidrug DMT transporter permease [Variovorax paradoxus]|uniref:Multidrug DMT transporter permease n=1 Tax=Variovorax paradoxus TaxID=34073 RepID=A0A0D0MX90_VARPD|nr:DMT family transporter [Variovorax paradoxus]KIQ33825.1 multidrug DMT transporter permease [Variovorax paradoxus]